MPPRMRADRHASRDSSAKLFDRPTSRTLRERSLRRTDLQHPGPHAVVPTAQRSERPLTDAAPQPIAGIRERIPLERSAPQKMRSHKKSGWHPSLRQLVHPDGERAVVRIVEGDRDSGTLALLLAAVAERVEWDDVVCSPQQIQLRGEIPTREMERSIAKWID